MYIVLNQYLLYDPGAPAASGSRKSLIKL